MKFKINIQQSLPFHSDKNLFHSIVQNLVENPIKYRDKNKENSFLDIEVLVNEKETKFSFKDNGPGITEELKEKIFDMFFKVNPSSDGTGLGLYIVKTSVEKLGGKITLQTGSGRGCLFNVVFPSI